MSLDPKAVMLKVGLAFLNLQQLAVAASAISTTQQVASKALNNSHHQQALTLTGSKEISAGWCASNAGPHYYLHPPPTLSDAISNGPWKATNGAMRRHRSASFHRPASLPFCCISVGQIADRKETGLCFGVPLESNTCMSCHLYHPRLRLWGRSHYYPDEEAIYQEHLLRIVVSISYCVLSYPHTFNLSRVLQPPPNEFSGHLKKN